VNHGGTAVLGASGFIGNRLVEALHLAGMRVTPIVRQPSGLALPGRFDLSARVADALDAQALSAAFAGCETAVVAVAGDPRTIVGLVDPVYRAAEAAGLRRLLYISTASVHGQAPAAGTDETTPLSAAQPIAYNNAKVRAERRLEHRRRTGSVETVLLRPGIVYGPRSSWTGGLADELLSGEAALVEGGHGICNAIYVDNLVHAVLLALAAPDVDGQAFLVGDRETITWRDLYRPVADALGIDVELLPTPPASAAARGAPLAERVRDSRAFKLLPPTVRAGLAAAYVARGAGRSASRDAGTPTITLEKALLHTCGYKLPWSRAEECLGYRPVVSFAEGCRRSVAWLEFAGYPVGGAG
jgi:nucleoside-diphosphate-sugar epimerase